jgi:NAD(P)-dependent dehydrogenase (short-subunit alcohol dehydrogenase family)
MASENEFEGKVALVTGATSGIGRATAIEFAAAGANVVAAGRRVEEGLSLEAEASELPGSILFVKTDVKIADDVKRMVGTAVDKFGGLDFAFNNAGGSKNLKEEGRTLLHQYTDDDIDDFYDMYLKSMWRSMKHELEVMLPAGHGVIINNASVLGVVGGPSAAYSMMKHGVVGLTRSAAKQYAGEGLRFNAVCPGWIDTEMTGSWKDDPVMSEYLIARQTIKRHGVPSEIASAVKWLCSDGASFVDGAAWRIDGGLAI